MSPKWRRRLAAGAFFSTLVLAPVSAFTFAREEPVTVLVLSWLALSLTLLDLWQTTDVRTQQEGEGE